MTVLSDLCAAPANPAFGLPTGQPNTKFFLRLAKATTSAVLGTFILGTDVLTPLAWIDATPAFTGLTYDRGADAGQAPGAGMLTFELDNSTDTYSPWRSIYWGPATLVQCGLYNSATGITSALFTGLVTDWDETDVATGLARYVTVTALENAYVLGQVNNLAVAPIGAGENIAARVARILAAAGWQFGGTVTVDAPHSGWGFQATTLAEDPWTEIQLAAQSIACTVRNGRSGGIEITERSSGLFTLIGSTVPTVADSIKTTNTDALLISTVAAARAGGTASTYTQPGIVGRYQQRTHQFFNLRTQDPGANADLIRYASDILARSTQTYRPAEFELNTAHDVTVINFLTALDIGTRLKVYHVARDATTVAFDGYHVAGYSVTVAPLTTQSLAITINVRPTPGAGSTWSHY